jgi:ligand-binding sensor protein
MNHREKEIYKFNENIISKLKNKLDANDFYLGGQILMKYDDEISLNNIENVSQISNQREKEYGVPYNSFEASSIMHHKNTLEVVKNMIVKYCEIIELRNVKYINELFPPSPP